MTTKTVLGIDMGATHIRFCLMQSENVVKTEKHKTAEILAQGIWKGLVNFCMNFVKDLSVSQIIIGLPAAISKDRKQVLSVPNLSVNSSQWDNLVPQLKEAFRCEVYLERDVNLQLIYDVHQQQLIDKFVLGIYLGTGIGFSIWLQGKLFIGAHGVAGELGHIPYGANQQCCCGNIGCLETAYSGRAIHDWYKSQPRDFPLTELFQHIDQISFLQTYLTEISKAIATTVNLFDPDTLIIGGGLADMANFPFESLVEQTQKLVRKPLPFDALKITKAESSDFSGAIGAAIYANLQGK